MGSVIDERIRTANFFVALVSTESMRSDLLREEIKLAQTFSRRTEDPLKILPIRIAYLGDLPYNFACLSQSDPIRLFDPILFTLWLELKSAS
jgi:hypothetical protein